MADGEGDNIIVRLKVSLVSFEFAGKRFDEVGCNTWLFCNDQCFVAHKRLPEAAGERGELLMEKFGLLHVASVFCAWDDDEL